VPLTRDKRVLRDELAAARAAVEALRSELDERTTRDPCTRLYLHGAFLRAATGELDRAQRDGRPVSLALVDIDGFRALNHRRCGCGA
jgi:GGDEF domain-containing protein